MNRTQTFMVLFLLCSVAWARPLKIEQLQLELGSDWQVKQNVKMKTKKVFRFRTEDQSVQFFVSQNSLLNPTQMFVKNALEASETWSEEKNNLPWNFVETTYVAPGATQRQMTYTIGFWMTLGEHTYYGYVSGPDGFRNYQTVSSFLNQLSPLAPKSLTDGFFYGKKYYLGFGEYLTGWMGNEVKYDIAHTHDIFTKDIGGSYEGTKILGPGLGGKEVRAYWEKMKENMTWNDMYVQYSSGHGHYTGLAIGLSYDEIRDNALSLPAKEVVIFLMACKSGNLVDSFNKKKHLWESWSDYNRTLLVIASSRSHEDSFTGPGTDPDEPGGPNGSAGSAFGHALWKALTGKADGFGNGVNDDLISIGEIIDYTKWKTESFGHTPVHTGHFERELIMNRVPTKAELAQFKGGTQDLSDEEIAEKIQELDKALSLR